MRLAILIPFAAFGLTLSAAWADGPLIRSAVGSHSGFIVPEAYAREHKADLVVSIPGLVKIDGFWTPTEQDVTVAERVLGELIQTAVKDPSILFPDLVKNTDPAAPDSFEHEQDELAMVSRNYESYLRQYVGIIIEGQKLIFCNYSDGAKTDPSADYIFIQKVFVPGGTIHFLQCRFDPETKTCSHVSIIGSWRKKGN